MNIGILVDWPVHGGIDMNIGVISRGMKIPSTADLYLDIHGLMKLWADNRTNDMILLGNIFPYFTLPEMTALFLRWRRWHAVICPGPIYFDEKVVSWLYFWGYYTSHTILPPQVPAIDPDDRSQQEVMDSIQAAFAAAGRASDYAICKHLLDTCENDQVSLPDCFDLKKDRPLIILRLNGGVGDQLLRYACARRLALELNANICFDDAFLRNTNVPGRRNLLQHFRVVGRNMGKEESKSFFSFIQNMQGQHRVEEKYAAVLNEKFQLQENPNIGSAGDVIYIHDRLGEYSFFEDIVPLLKKELTLKLPPAGQNAMFANAIMDCSTSVSLHIRLTDFVAIGFSKPMDYYLKAMEIMAGMVGDPHFFIFSDDMNWVKGNLFSSYPLTFVEHNDLDQGYEDLRLMSLCRHHIISNSRFGWWAAFLCQYEDKIVLRPQGPEGYYPEQWIDIESS